MIRRFIFPLAALATLLTACEPLTAEEEETTFTLAKALLYNCKIREASDGPLFDFGVSYLEHTEGRPSPQINFRDPTKRFFTRTGWAPKGEFAISRLLPDGRLFIWNGGFNLRRFPEINSTVEIVPAQSAEGKASIIVKSFEATDAGIKDYTFGGSCDVLSGAPAYYGFSKGWSE